MTALSLCLFSLDTVQCLSAPASSAGQILVKLNVIDSRSSSTVMTIKILCYLCRENFLRDPLSGYRRVSGLSRRTLSPSYSTLRNFQDKPPAHRIHVHNTSRTTRDPEPPRRAEACPTTYACNSSYFVSRMVDRSTANDSIERYQVYEA